jgi:hypothetical protein
VYSYNGSRGPRDLGEPVRDLRARIDLQVTGRDPAGGPAFWLDIRNGDVIYRLALPVGEGSGEVLRLPPELAAAERLPVSHGEGAATNGDGGSWSVLAPLPPESRLEPNRRHEVDFSVVDRQVRVLLDGVLLLEQPLDPRDADAGTGHGESAANGVTLRARRIGGIVERVRLYRDIHYTESNPQYRYAVHEPYRIPDDGYFAMGDNSPSSLDSRAWGALRGQNLLGRAFVVFWPALPWDFDLKFIH